MIPSLGRSWHRLVLSGLKEEEFWTAEYRAPEQARTSIARWIEAYNQERPRRGIENRTLHEAFLAFAGVLKNEALIV
ncbi:MAG: integrase core domain-containing protein [Candidatus Acidiferrales bacterium]